MAFDATNYDPGHSPKGSAPRVHTYGTAADAIATVVGATYFDGSIAARLMTVGDAILLRCTDGTVLRRVSAKSGTDVTLAADIGVA